MIFGPAGAIRSQAQQDHQAFVEEAKGSGKHDNDLLAQALKDNIKDMSNPITEKSGKKAARLSNVAEAKGDLGVAKSANAKDEAKLSDPSAECSAWAYGI